MTAPSNTQVNPFDKVRPLVLRSIIGSLVAAALVAVFSVIVGDFGELSWRLMGTIALFVFFALCSWYDADVSSKRATWFGYASIVSTILLLIIGLQKIWFPFTSSFTTSEYTDYDYGYSGLESFGAWVWITVIVRVALLHVHLLLTLKKKFTTPLMTLVNQITFTLVPLLALGLILPAFFNHYEFTEFYWRTVAVVAILDVLGTVLIPLSYALFAPKDVKSQNRYQNQQFSPAAEATGYPTQEVINPGNSFTPNYEPNQLGAGPSSGSPLVSSEPPMGVFEAALPASSFVPAQGHRRLAWPCYEDGIPLPMLPDGRPDFSGVHGSRI